MERRIERGEARSTINRPAIIGGDGGQRPAEMPGAG
jgi:hypothetical protein